MFLFESKYIIGKIPHVLNMKRQRNRPTCLLVHALYAEIHFITTSKIVRAIHSITNRPGNSGSCTEFKGIVVIFIFN